MKEISLSKSTRIRRLATFAVLLLLCALIIIVIMVALTPAVSRDDFGNVILSTPETIR